MNAVRVRRKLESETLYLPELKPLVGKTVEIIVREASTTPVHSGDWDREVPESGAEPSGCYNTLFAPKPLDAAARKALKAMLTKEQYEALVDIANQGGPDVEVIGKLRAATRQ